MSQQQQKARKEQQAREAMRKIIAKSGQDALTDYDEMVQARKRDLRRAAQAAADPTVRRHGTDADGNTFYQPPAQGTRSVHVQGDVPQQAGGARMRRCGTREDVWAGRAHHTVGGLTKKDLTKRGNKIMSKKMIARGKKAFKNIAKYVKKARK